MDKSKFTERFKELIGDSTQKEVAEKINSNQTTVSKLLSGKMEPPVDTLVNIASAYNCSVDYLLGLSSTRNDLKQYTYSDFLRIVNYLVSNKLAVIRSACFPTDNERTTLYFIDSRIEEILKDYQELDFGKKLFSLWYENELKKQDEVI